MRIFFMLALAFMLVSPAHAQLSADDFLPPVQASSPEEREKLMAVQGEVQTVVDEVTGDTVVQADTIQNAINYVVNQNDVGTKLIRVDSGLAWVATGNASYNVMPNPTATRYSRRAAFVQAFLSAKSAMAQTLNGMSLQTRVHYLGGVDTQSDAFANLTNVSDSLEEQLEQSVRMLLRGFVVYSVADNPEKPDVTVSIVTSPKTLGQFQRPAHDRLAAADLRGGLNMVFTEIQNGLIPPVGGRMIAVDETGEMAFVGFGSAIVPIDDNPGIQSRLQLEAQKIANMRASDALAGMIIGDDTMWKGKVDSSTSDMTQRFERSDDPNDPGIRVLDQAREAFLATSVSTTELQSLRRGVLPPGVQRRSFTSEDNAEVVAVAVYIPSVTEQARQAAKQMREAQLIDSGAQQQGQQGQRQQGGSIFQAPANVPTPSSTVSPGPTGQVSQDKDL